MLTKRLHHGDASYAMLTPQYVTLYVSNLIKHTDEPQKCRTYKVSLTLNKIHLFSWRLTHLKKFCCICCRYAIDSSIYGSFYFTPCMLGNLACFNFWLSPDFFHQFSGIPSVSNSWDPDLGQRLSVEDTGRHRINWNTKDRDIISSRVLINFKFWIIEFMFTQH